LVLIGGMGFVGSIIIAMESPDMLAAIWIMTGIIELTLFYAIAKIITYLKGIHENTANNR